jgi:hypothetical protein
LLDEPKPRGFDRELQNLIILVFALQQQLGWYEGEGDEKLKVNVTATAAVRDQHELRHPPMPPEADWKAAVRRGQMLFGEVLPLWRTPANLAEAAGTMRRVATGHQDVARQLVAELTKRADLLGLDPEATSGRLATARRVATLLSAVAAERDDVLLVSRVATADLGDVDEKAASEAYKQAKRLIDAMANTEWAVLDAVATRADAGDERAAPVVAQLRVSARHEQHGCDLAAALRTAVRSAAALLAAAQPPAGKTGADHTPGGNRRAPVRHQRPVSDRAAVATLAKQLAAEVDAGRTVIVTWEIQ